MKTWNLYCDKPFYGCDYIVGETIEEAIESNLDMLARHCNHTNYHIGDVLEYEYEYSTSILGGTGGVEIKIYYMGCEPYVNAPYVKKINVVWIFADEFFEPLNKKKEKSNIKEAREKTGLTQAKMSEIFDIPKRTIESWEAGVRKPPKYVEKLIIEKLEQIAQQQR